MNHTPHMTTTRYLQIQADLLIARRLVRDLPIAEFLVKLAEGEESGKLVDSTGCAIATDFALMRSVAESARGLQTVLLPGEGQRKPPTSEMMQYGQFRAKGKLA